MSATPLERYESGMSPIIKLASWLSVKLDAIAGSECCTELFAASYFFLIFEKNSLTCFDISERSEDV